jgi:predicted TIM-barrel fold metal-dependent hydrolase
LKKLDEAGVQRQVLSYVGAAYDGVMTPDEARPFWRAQNDDLGALVKKHPTRFTGLATLPTAHVAAAARNSRARIRIWD